jgi:hypothetical protein
MARNAADAADATRPKGENFSASSGPAQTAACRITLSDIVAHFVDAEKLS